MFWETNAHANIAWIDLEEVWQVERQSKEYGLGFRRPATDLELDRNHRSACLWFTREH